MSAAERSPVVACPRAAPSRILLANLLFLISLVLVQTVGLAAQVWRLWPGMIITEVFCILLPTWHFARKAGSTVEALRLRWVGAAPCWLGLALGVALYPLAATAESLTEKILRYRFSMPDSSSQQGFGSTLVYLLAIVVAAPFCEEVLFRGYILGAYESTRWRPRTVTLAVAGLCTAYHVSPVRALGVTLVGVAVTFIALHTGSVWPSIAGHIGTNGASALLVIARGRTTDLSAHALSLLTISATVIAAFCVWRISRLRAKPRVPSGERRRGEWWPLWVAGTVVAGLASTEMVMHLL